MEGRSANDSIENLDMSALSLDQEFVARRSSEPSEATCICEKVSLTVAEDV